MQISDIKGTFTLANGVKMPYFGLGLFRANDGTEVVNAIHYALDAGYRLFDTATIYGNETGVGTAISTSKINRKDFFITTKVWNADQGYNSTLKAFEASLNKLQTEYIDLYLIHWPVAGLFKETWKAMEALYRKGKVRAIGVSNFMQSHLEDLMSEAEIIPMVNQMEFHPYLVQSKLLAFCKKNKIQYESWSPIMKGRVVNIPELTKIGEKYDKNEVQIVLRWNLQKGVVTIPKSVQKDRIFSNANIFDFELSDIDMRAIDLLDKNQRNGPDPNNFSF